MNKVIVVTGPTASGKTAYAVSLAHKFNAEVVSADSMQIYKYMNIGTAKPTEAEMEGVPHHMINIVSPLENFSVVKYQEMAKACIDDILARGKTPIVCGGTGLYISSLLYNIKYADIASDDVVRKRLHKEAEIYGNEYLYNKLIQADPKAAGKIHMNNVKRVVRALEVYEVTGKHFSKYEAESLSEPTPYEFETLYLEVDRPVLYERINKRVDEMIESGLVEETKFLYENGMLDGSTASQGICYKEMLPYVSELLAGKEDEEILSECAGKLKQSTRNYAKRQITWFKNMNMFKSIYIKN